MNDLWSEAIAEAYAAAPVDVSILPTLEIWHPNFDAALRVVQADEDQALRLEPAAPRDAGAIVAFQAIAFEVQLPELGEGVTPAIQFKVDGVSSALTAQLAKARQARAPVDMIYREFTTDDTTGPGFVLPDLQMRAATLTSLSFVGTATYHRLTDRMFPGLIYRPSAWPGLLR